MESPAIEKQDRILLVDDDETILVLMQLYLEDVAEVVFASDGLTALKRAVENMPDLILLDANLPDISGLEVCRSLKSNPATAEIPVLFLTGRSDEAFEAEAFRAGASDYLLKPITPERVLMRVQVHLKLKNATDELRAQSLTDALTRIPNRRAFDNRLEQEWRRARRTAQDLAIVMLDIDHFKQVNDRFGHAAGDVCLQRVAEVLEQNCERAGDMVCRFGGEEFAILMASMNREALESNLGRLIKAIESIMFEADERQPMPGKITISAGAVLVYFSEEGMQQKGLMPISGMRAAIATADAQLYAAKDAGRNTFHFACGKFSPP